MTRELQHNIQDNFVAFQDRVKSWLLSTFGAWAIDDKTERADRFMEEAFELLQSLDYPKERALAMIEYVYGRPKGEPAQELGGTLLTLSTLASAHDLDLSSAAWTELSRAWLKADAIRAKQATKPQGAALPTAAAVAAAEAAKDRLFHAGAHAERLNILAGLALAGRDALKAGSKTRAKWMNALSRSISAAPKPIRKA